MPSADCYTNHRLVRCKIAFTFESPPNRNGPQTQKPQVNKLRDSRVKTNLQVMLDDSTENTPEIQCGLRFYRGTVDMIFVLRQLQERCKNRI